MGYYGYLATLIASASISIMLAVFFWRRRPAPGAVTLAGLTVATLFWAAGYLVEELTTTLAGRQIANDIEYIGFVSVPVIWFIFTIQYSRYENFLNRRLYLLFIVPAITLILVWTNNLHGVMWRDARLETFGQFIVQIKTYGPWFWVHSLYSYLLILSGVAIIAVRLFHPRNIYRYQIILMLFGIIFPLVWNGIYIFRAAPTYHIDMTPTAFVVSGIVLALGLFRFNILKIVPIARGTVVENMNDGVIVLDKQNQILDINRAAEGIIGSPASSLMGQSTNLLWAKHPVLKTLLQKTGGLKEEITIGGDTDGRHYELSIIPLYDRSRALTARVITLHDLTERKKMEQSLEEYARRVTQVQEEERARVARELHDDTAQNLALLSLEVDSLLNSPEIQSEKTLGKLRKLKEDTDRSMNDVRRYSHALRPGVLDYLGLEAALEQLVAETREISGVDIRFETQDKSQKLPEEVELALFRIAQEAVNNIRKHAQASSALVLLEFTQGKVKLLISDNGKGFSPEDSAKAHEERGRLGLMGMQERAHLIGARLNLKSESGQGTTVLVELDI